MNERKTFVFYSEWKEIIQEYPAELKIELYEAIVDYAMGNEIELSPTAKFIFPFFKKKIDEDRATYLAKCEKLKENGKKGGRPNGTKRNQIKPNGFFENQMEPNGTKRNQIGSDNDNDHDYELLSYSNELDNNKEKKNNINIIQKKEKTFTEVFDEFKSELLGENTKLWRETVKRLFGVKNHSLALDEFKAHIIAQGKEQNVIKQSLNDFKAYFSNSARMNFLSEQAKTVPPEPPKRKPCEFYTQRDGRYGIIGVIKQDGKTYYVPKDVGFPPTEQHFWNPDTKKYEV